MTYNDDLEFHPSSDINVEVRRFNISPLTYTIFPSFSGVAKILHELSMPTGSDQSYSLSFVSVIDFLKYSGCHYHRIAERYRRYTVETFGLRIKLPPRFYLGMDVPYPDSSQYKNQPTYWVFGGILYVQVWRLRIISCPMEDLKINVSNPFGTLPSGTVYVEERWNPKKREFDVRN